MNDLNALQAADEARNAAGAQLANVAFNWAQQMGYVLTSDDCEMLRKLYQQWDAARNVTPKLIDRLRKAEAASKWQPIETAPKDGTEIDIWVSGPGSRRIANCRWGQPKQSNWGDRYGDDKNLPEQWITRDGFSLDRRNGIASHYMPLPLPPTAGADADTEGEKR